MITMEVLSFYIMICVLAPLIGAFTLLFLFSFEKKFEALENQATQLVLEKELESTKFEVLSQKIQPHFFFNTLNMILSLARLDRKKDLIHSIETLAQFMKRKYTSNHALATIEEEITYTNYYLDIQKLRLAHRLTVEIDVDSMVKQALIPVYVIQTLTENCFKHSFEKYTGKAELKISIQQQNDTIILTVWNNKMSGMAHFQPPELNPHASQGIGLKNIRDRISLLYPKNSASLSLQDDDTGTTVKMNWPLHLT